MCRLEEIAAQPPSEEKVMLSDKPITVAIVGDDPHALEIKAKLQGLNLDKIVIVGGDSYRPQYFERPFASHPMDMDIMSIYANPRVELKVPSYYEKPEPVAISPKLQALLNRAKRD
jgi:hypothetical protein